MIQLSIMSAEMKRLEVELRKADREAWLKEIEAQRPARVEKLVEQVFNFARSKIELCEHSSCEITITDDEKFLWKPWDDSELREAIADVATLLKMAGYEVSTHEYSKGWKTRSGKFGYLYVNW